VIARLWATWKPLAQRIGDFQARVILTLLYTIILGPYALFIRLFKDPLRARPSPKASLWISTPSEPATLERARRQF
jgi:hypothetical protein